MKRYFLLAVLLSLSLCFAQRNELKINTITIFNGRLDISYERKLNNHFSIGINTGVGFAERDYEKRKLLLKPFGRYFVNNKNDFKGFFLQTSLLYYAIENLPVPPEENFSHQIGTYHYFGPTIGIGYKFLVHQKIPLETYIDAGPDLLGNNSWLPSFVGEAGVSIGYRF